MKAIAFALEGRPGSRLAAKLEMPVSGDTLLRIIRKTSEDSQTTPKVIGIDNGAKRRGQVYGTIIVDLERRQVIDLLEDRTAATKPKLDTLPLSICGKADPIRLTLRSQAIA